MPDEKDFDAARRRTRAQAAKRKFVKLGVLLVAAVVASGAYLYVAYRNDPFHQPPDPSLLVAPQDAATLGEGTVTIPRSGYIRQDYVLNEQAQLTYAFVAAEKAPLSICIAHPANEDAFASGEHVDCLAKDGNGFQGQLSHALPGGTYAVFIRGEANVSLQYKAWTRG